MQNCPAAMMLDAICLQYTDLPRSDRIPIHPLSGAACLYSSDINEISPGGPARPLHTDGQRRCPVAVYTSVRDRTVRALFFPLTVVWPLTSISKHQTRVM